MTVVLAVDPGKSKTGVALSVDGALMRLYCLRPMTNHWQVDFAPGTGAATIAHKAVTEALAWEWMTAGHHIDHIVIEAAYVGRSAKSALRQERRAGRIEGILKAICAVPDDAPVHYVLSKEWRAGVGKHYNTEWPKNSDACKAKAKEMCIAMGIPDGLFEDQYDAAVMNWYATIAFATLEPSVSFGLNL